MRGGNTGIGGGGTIGTGGPLKAGTISEAGTPVPFGGRSIGILGRGGGLGGTFAGRDSFFAKGGSSSEMAVRGACGLTVSLTLASGWAAAMVLAVVN